MVAKQPVSPENPGKKPFRSFTMRQEAYPNRNSDEFLDEFNKQLIEHGFNPDELVYSGFERKDVRHGRRPRLLTVFVMDQKGWRAAIRQHRDNPATFAEGCIGLYDKHQLLECFGGDPDFPESISEEEQVLDDSDTTFKAARGAVMTEHQVFTQRLDVTNIEPGDALDEIAPDRVVDENVIHRDYPHSLATDALVGLVYIDT